MKIRLGFVSNSSSSSFIVCGLNFETREKLLEAYKLVRDDLTEQDIENILGEEGPYGLPDFPGLELRSDEWDDDIQLGVVTDPTCLDVDDCLNGFVGKDQYELLKGLADQLGMQIMTHGGTEYC